MPGFNSEKNRIVWVDIPVVDLERANRFYGGVLDIECHVIEMENFSFTVLDHHDGNGGTLIPHADLITQKGPLIYHNCNGRLAEAMGLVEELGGLIVEPVHQIGEHGFRGIILDSEGNKCVLHSDNDD